MAPFVAGAVRLAGGFAVASPIDHVFPLFSPVGETLWVPGWNPELLYPPGVEWAEGLIFRTREELGDAIWIVTRLDRTAHVAEYHRIEPDRYVAHVTVRCTQRDRSTSVDVAYEFIGLSQRGNADIALMTDEAYADKMTRWQRMVTAALQARA